MRAIKYMRWSSEKQSKGSSLSRQTGKIDEFCTAMGWPIVETVVDEGVSAYSGANLYEGGLAKLRERFVREGGEGYVLVVEQLDRLSRLDTLTVIEFFIAMTRTGLTIATAQGRMIVDAVSLKNQTSQLEEIVRESHRANREGSVRSDRSRGAWDEMRERGGIVHVSATCPAWLKLNKDRTAFTIDEPRAEIVRSIFRDYIAGVSKRTIARKLNEAKVKPFRGATQGWQPSAVVALLKSRAVIGEYQYQSRARGEKLGDPVADYFPPIIDNEMWQAAHNARHHKVMTGRGREVAHRNILSDIAVCAECGWRMRMNRKTARAKASYVTTYLQCSNYDLRKGCTHSKMHRLDRFEGPILDNLLTLALDDQTWSDETAVPLIAARLADKRRDLGDLTTRLANVVKEIERRPSDRVSKRLEELEDEESVLLADIVEIETELATAKGAVSPAEHLKRVGEIRNDMDLDDEEGIKARLTIKLALNDIVEAMGIAPSGRAAVMVKSGLRNLIIEQDGSTQVVDFHNPARSYREIDDPAIIDYLRRRADEGDEKKKLGSGKDATLREGAISEVWRDAG